MAASLYRSEDTGRVKYPRVRYTDLDNLICKNRGRQSTSEVEM
jgi:hypothetical protein